MRDKRVWIIPFVIAVIVSLLSATSISLVFRRDRPMEAEHIEPIGEAGEYEEYAKRYPTVIEFFLERFKFSFPSGNTAIHFSHIPILSFVIGKWWLWVGFASWIAFTRVYVGAHFLSDVIFGAMLGLVIGWFLLKLFLNPSVHRKGERFINLMRGSFRFQPEYELQQL